MKRSHSFMAVLGLSLFLAPGVTFAQSTTYFYNADGTNAGRSQSNGDTTYYYNSDGTSAGRSQGMGNSRGPNRNSSPFQW